MSITGAQQPFSRAEQEDTRAWMFFAGTFLALIISGIWSMVVGTSSPGADEKDLVQGWEGVMRNSPGYLLLIVVASFGVWFATKAGIHGSPRAKNALIATSLVLLFALSSVTRDSAAVVMTTRDATVAWLAFGIDAVIVGLVYFAARRQVTRASGR